MSGAGGPVWGKHLATKPAEALVRFCSGRDVTVVPMADAELLPYENEASLKRLQNAYREVGEMLRRRRKLVVLELDASEADAETLAQRVEAACLDLNRTPGKAGNALQSS